MVVRTALRVAELALSVNDRKTLLQRLAEDKELSTSVDDREIDCLLHNTLGTPSSGELCRMHLMHKPFVDSARRSARRFVRGNR